MSDYSPPSIGPRIWLLRLVAPGRYGRVLTGLVLLAFSLAVYWFGGILSAEKGSIPGEIKAVALFFSVIFAYTVPVFHYITERTAAALEALSTELEVVESELPAAAAELPHLITNRPVTWQLGNLLLGTSLWLIQSWFLAGGFAGMLQALTGDIGPALIALGALPVWICTTVTLHALANNAKLFRQLARIVPIDLLHTTSLMAFGRMAVTAVLVVVGNLASFSIMFFGGVNTPWAWGPGLLMGSAVLIYLLVAPVAPLRERLRAKKAQALASVNVELRTTRGMSDLASDGNRRQLSELLVVREEVQRVPEWPFDMDLLARLGIYLVIVPMTWVGAALIENVVDLFLD